MRRFSVGTLLWGLLSCSANAGAPAPAPSAEPRPPVEDPPAAFDHTHAAWSALLASHVVGDRVDYRGLARERAELDAYLARLAAVTPSELGGWTEEQRFAFWINVYNAFCIQLVLDGYPVDSIRDLGGALIGRVWDKEFIPLAAHHPEGSGDALSLNDVEHGILRERFEDARLHAAVNCASYSCPPLRAEAFVAGALDRQLEESMRGFLADRRRNRFDDAAARIEISQIFDWFEEDFERDAGSVRAFIARFAPVEETDWVLEAEVRYVDYDWSLNDVE